MISPEDAKAAIAAKIAQSVRTRPSPARPSPSSGKAKPTATEAEPPPAPSVDGPGAPPDVDAIEDSILAAIAEAVDVLVDDEEDGTKVKRGRTAPKKKAAAPASPAPESKTRSRSRAAPKHDVSEDIGDEIQRIIASYNRNRDEDASQ